MADPTVSVIMPARNAASVIDAQLAALSRQSIPEGWELIVVDHASRDATFDRARAWESRLPCLKVVDGSAARSIPEVRNLGLAEARGSVLVHCDADDVVDDGWLAAMVRALKDAPLVTGPLDVLTLNDGGMFRWRDDAPNNLPRSEGFLPFGLTCNLGTRREVVDRIGGFDPAFRCGADVDFTFRAQEAGFRLAFDDAVLVHRRLPGGAFAYWRRQVHYARYSPLIWKRHRHFGMPRASLLTALLMWGWLVLHLPDLLSQRWRWRWLTYCAYRVGRIIGSVEHRVLYL